MNAFATFLPAAHKSPGSSIPTRKASKSAGLTQRLLSGPGGELDGKHLLPGFRYPISDVFKEWDWE